MMERIVLDGAGMSRSDVQTATLWCALACILLGVVGGCSNAPPAIRPPDIDADQIATDAFSQYDRDSDGLIAGEELRAAPALKFSRDRIDQNGDKKISPEELRQLVQTQWIDMESGLIRIRCNVTMNGRPLDGATVTLEPEQFMGGAISHAAGVTRGGMARLDVSDEDRPDPNAHGVQHGMYLVRISLKKGDEELIPAKYNTETTLGCEVAKRAAYMPGPVRFDLRSQ